MFAIKQRIDNMKVVYLECFNNNCAREEINCAFKLCHESQFLSLTENCVKWFIVFCMMRSAVIIYEWNCLEILEQNGVCTLSPIQYLWRVKKGSVRYLQFNIYVIGASKGVYGIMVHT